MASNDQIKQARNAYMREWRRKNPERAKEISDRYWERRAERLKAEKSTSTETEAKEGAK